MVEIEDFGKNKLGFGSWHQEGSTPLAMYSWRKVLKKIARRHGKISQSLIPYHLLRNLFTSFIYRKSAMSTKHANKTNSCDSEYKILIKSNLIIIKNKF